MFRSNISEAEIKSDFEQATRAAQSELIQEIAQQLTARSGNQLEATELADKDLNSLGLNLKYVFAKTVKLPANFRPTLELHNNSDQLTVILSGSLVWVQASQEFVPKLLKSGESIYTKADEYHGHCTGKEPAVVLALFTSSRVLKDSIKEFDWSAVSKLLD